MPRSPLNSAILPNMACYGGWPAGLGITIIYREHWVQTNGLVNPKTIQANPRLQEEFHSFSNLGFVFFRPERSAAWMSSDCRAAEFQIAVYRRPSSVSWDGTNGSCRDLLCSTE